MKRDFLISVITHSIKKLNNRKKFALFSPHFRQMTIKSLKNFSPFLQISVRNFFVINFWNKPKCHKNQKDIFCLNAIGYKVIIYSDIFSFYVFFISVGQFCYMFWYSNLVYFMKFNYFMALSLQNIKLYFTELATFFYDFQFLTENWN